MSIEIIDVQGMLPNPLVAGVIHEHRDFIEYQDGDQYVALPGLTIIYSVDGEQKTHHTTEREFFFKNSAETQAHHALLNETGDPSVLNLWHLNEAFTEYRNDKEKFINRIREYYGVRLS